MRDGEEAIGGGTYVSFADGRLVLRETRDGRDHVVRLSGDMLDAIDRYVRRLSERGRRAS